MKKPEKAAEATGLRELIRTDERWAIGALMKLYQYQTMDEQNEGTTKYENSVGFNGVDAEFMTSLAKQYERKGYLSDKQLTYVKGKLQKYVSQLLRHGGTIPLENKKLVKRERAAYKRAFLEGDLISIDFSYDPAVKDQVKTLSGRRWAGPERKTIWTAPFCLGSVESLVKWGFVLDPELQKAYDKLINPLHEGIKIPGLKKELFPFQKEGVAFIESREGRAVIGDEMGLGKTAQALAWLQLHPEARPAVVVVPASVKINWAREAQMWMSEPRTTILSGRSPDKQPPIWQDGIVIINYDILSYWARELIALGPKVVILDECHYIKNRQAKRTKAVFQIAHKVPHIICLSGTPIVNRPVEFFNALHVTEPKLFPSFWRYARTYCGARHNGFGWDFTGATNIEELHETLTKTIFVRRLKGDVLKELPEKIRSVVPMEMKPATRKEYQKAHFDFLSWIKDVDPSKLEAAQQAEALVRIERLKQLSIKGKVLSCVEWIRDHLEVSDKLVVFCTHQKTVDQLAEHLKEFNPVKVDGRTQMKQRQDCIDAFQNLEDCRLFIGNIKAAGVGINLTAANATCFVELGWTPGDHDQAEDRVHRIGQMADSVMAYYLIASGTIEEDISFLLDKKRAVLSAVLDGKEVEETSMLMELLNSAKIEGGSEREAN